VAHIVTTLKGYGQTRHIPYMRKRGYEYKILVRKPKGKSALGRHSRRWEANMKIIHKEMCSCVESGLVRLTIRSSFSFLHNR